MQDSDSVSSGEKQNKSQLHQNQPYDESLDVPDSEDVPSIITPTPRERSGVKAPGDTPPDMRMSDNDNSEDDDEFDDKIEDDQAAIVPSQTRPQAPSKQQSQRLPFSEEEGSESSEEDDDDDDDDDGNNKQEGAYDPAEFENLNVSPEIQELFQYIIRYTPQVIELEHKLKPFIPDFIPAVGDIDAFIKVTRTDNKSDSLGLTVLDEPCAKQSDPTVLDLQMRAISKQSVGKQVVVKSVDGAEKSPKQIDRWINSIQELHRSKPPANVHYSKNMPDVDTLMQEWPAEFEELLKQIELPSADQDCDLSQYVDIITGILDIPIHKESSQRNEKIQSLHLLFTLFSEFKNSLHFGAEGQNSGTKFSSDPNSATGYNQFTL